MLILDLRDRPLSGKAYAERLAKAGIITNFNMVPGDPRDPAVTSGIRLGGPAVTSMGMRDVETVQIARFIDSVLWRARRRRSPCLPAKRRCRLVRCVRGPGHPRQVRWAKQNAPYNSNTRSEAFHG